MRACVRVWRCSRQVNQKRVSCTKPRLADSLNSVCFLFGTLLASPTQPLLQHKLFFNKLLVHSTFLNRPAFKELWPPFHLYTIFKQYDGRDLVRRCPCINLWYVHNRRWELHRGLGEGGSREKKSNNKTLMLYTKIACLHPTQSFKIQPQTRLHNQFTWNVLEIAEFLSASILPN